MHGEREYVGDEIHTGTGYTQKRIHAEMVSIHTDKGHIEVRCIQRTHTKGTYG